MNTTAGHAEHIEAWAMRHGYKPKAQQFDFTRPQDFELDAGRAPEQFRLDPPSPAPGRGTPEWQERRDARLRELEARKAAREGVTA